jgi:hypothetical protein
MGLLIEMTSATWGRAEIWGRGWEASVGRVARTDAEHIAHSRFFGFARGNRPGGGLSAEVAMGRLCIWLVCGPERRALLQEAAALPPMNGDRTA